MTAAIQDVQFLVCALVPHPPLPSPTWAKLATIATVVPGVQKVVGRQCALEDSGPPTRRLLAGRLRAACGLSH